MRRLKSLLVALAIGLPALCSSLAPVAADPAPATSFTPQQTQDIRTIIKNYLMENPEILRDAITELDAREKRAEAAAQKKAIAEVAGQLANGPDGFVVGNPDGKITLVEFFDYNCGFCKRALPDMTRLLSDNKDLKLVLRDYPILAQVSFDAALIAVAAHKQFPGAKYWDYHRKLLAMRSPVGRDQAIAVAKEMGADLRKLEDDAAAPDTRKAIQQSDSLAKALSLNGTPTYIIGDSVLVGAVGYEKINEAIGNVRKCGKALCS